jgi:hypothetical protein
MGTASSANDEWIELYNNGTSSVSLEGWAISATDGSPNINLTGSINAGSYYLCERTDDTNCTDSYRRSYLQWRIIKYR